MVFESLDKALAAAGVGVTTVHEAVDIDFFKTVVLRDVAERIEMVERRVNATVAGKSHKMDGLAVVAGIGERIYDFRVGENRAVLACLVDFHKVLIDHATGTDIEVSHFRVAHLAVGKTDVFT